MSDREGANGLNYVSAGDPRTAHYPHAQIGFDNATPVVRSARYTSFSHSVPVADGIQARLIEAEAALHAGGDWLGILNALRADVAALLRRLIRQYGRAAESVFPTGTWHKGGTYGTDVSMPIPFNEINNTFYDPAACVTTRP